MRHVLLVDDKEMMRESMTAALERAGFTVTCAPDGATALILIAARRPDAMVTDLRMPGMTGLELLERVRQIDDDLPIILMTAFGAIDTAVKAMRLGAFDYLTKPFDGDELIIAIKRACEHVRIVRENAVLRAANPEPVFGSQMSAGVSTTASMRGESGSPGGEAGILVPTPEAGMAIFPSDSSRDGAVTCPRRSAKPSDHKPATVRSGIDRLIGTSDAMRQLRDQIIAIADSGGTVLITGESGVGKEVVARAVHESSARFTHGGPFLAVNCAALSESLLESELFGHERGAFTGAERLRKGRFELSDRGTLLLDEISEISPTIQAKLLRVLQERSFERVGSSISIGVDVRVVATSNRDLLATVSKGEFRQDLYFRLNVLPLAVPALRERRPDIAILARHFVQGLCERDGRSPLELDPDTITLMEQYSWPGNVRELQNICERAVVLSPRTSSGDWIRPQLVAPWLAQRPVGAPLADLAPVFEPKAATVGAFDGHSNPSSYSTLNPLSPLVAFAPHPGDVSIIRGESKALELIERDAILEALVRFGGHRQRTADALGIGVRTLGLKLKKWKKEGVVSEML